MKISGITYYTVEETAKILDYYPPYVLRLIRDKKIVAIKRGRRYFISEAAISDYLGIELS